MPQPFRGAWIYGPDDLDKRPHLTKHIGAIAALWAMADHQRSVALAQVLGLEAEITTLMLTSITNDGAKSAAMRAIAEARVQKDRKSEFAQILSLFRTAEKQRNTVVHGLWGICEGQDDILVLLNPVTATRFYSALMSNGESHQHLSDLVDITLAYNKIDFENIARDIKRAMSAMNLFAQSHTPRSSLPEF